MHHIMHTLTFKLLFIFSLYIIPSHSLHGRAFVQNEEVDSVYKVEKDASRIAIIGAGIGGAACAYYTHKFGPNTVIDVYEQNSIAGGRLKHVTFGGEVVEVGGDAWSSVNYYLMEIMKDLIVPISNNSFDGNGKMGFFQGDGKWYTPKEELSSKLRMAEIVEGFRINLWENYKARSTLPFKTIEEFTKFGNLEQYSSATTENYLTSHKVAYDFMWGEILPIIRVIYDQNLNISAFAGIVSVLPDVTDAYSVEGGNSLLVEMLLKSSKANVLFNTKISQISFNGQYYNLSSPNMTFSAVYDKVVIAAPIEFADLQISGVAVPQITYRSFVHWYVTLVLADGLNPFYFGTSPVPDIVLTTENSTAPFVIISPQAKSESTGKIIYKIFSNGNMTSYLTRIFVGVSDSYVQVWRYTFPDLSPPMVSYQPTILGPSLFYINTMESVACAMEGSAISGRNVALLMTS